MKNKLYAGLQLKRHWLQLGVSLTLAFVFTFLILLLPGLTTAASSEQPGEVSLLPPLDVPALQTTGNLSITKVTNPSNFVDQGNFITYTLIVTNNTPDDLGFLVVSDPVPTNTSCDTIFDTIEVGGDGDWLGNQVACDNGTASWVYNNVNNSNSGGDFTPGETVQLVYRVAVTQPFPDQDSIINLPTYQAASANPDYVVTGTQQVSTTVNAPNWLITKSSSPTSTVQAGSRLTYTLVITNNGHLATSGPYTVSDDLPTFTNFISSNPSPAGISGQTVSWNFNISRAIDEAFSITLVLSVTQPLTDNTPLVNQSYSVTGGNVVSPGLGAPLTVTVRAPISLTVDKSDDPYDPVQAGDLLTYTVTITNDSNSTGPAQSLVFTDTLPTNTVLQNAGFVTPTSGLTSSDGSVITWTISSPAILPIGSAVQLTMTVRVQSPLPSGTLITNDSYGAAASNPSNVTPPLPITTTVHSAPQITLTKTVTPSEVVRGQQLTYTIVVTNSGNETAVNIPLTDTIQASDFSPNSANWTITVTGTDLAGNPGVVTRTLVVTAGTTAGQFPNFVTTTVTSPITIGPVATVTVRAPVDLAIRKERVGSGTVVTGEAITYTLTITNVAGSDTADAIISDTFANATVLTYTVTYTGATCDIGSNPVTCNVPALTGTTAITLVLDSSNSISGVITNTAFITPALAGLGDSITSNNRSEITTPVRYPIADLQIDKQRLGTDEIIVGDPVTYTIAITNASGSDPVEVVITDSVVNGEVLTYSTSSSGIMCSQSLSQLDCTAAAFTQTGTITLVVDTDNSISGTITNTAGITFSSAITGIETDSSNNVIVPPVTTPIRYPLADLQIDKVRLGSGEVIAGDSITYTITLTNAAGSDPVDVIVTDRYTGTVTNVISSTSTGASCTAGSSQIVCTFNNFSNTALITLTLDTAPTFSGTLTNSVVITPVSSVVVETNPGNERALVTDTVRQLEADLSIQKTGPMMVVADDLITYTIVITNAGLDAVDVVVTDTFGVEGTFVSATPTTGSCSGTGPVTCDFTDFSGVATITLVLDTTPTKVGLVITNTAEITAPAPNVIEQNPGNESDDVSTLIMPRQADLRIDKSRVGSGPVTPGDRITFTLAISNTGPHDVGATLGDSISPASSVTGIEISPPPNWSCSGLTSASVTCNTNSFTAGADDLVTVVVTTSATFSGTLTNNSNIQVASTASEVDSSDNFSSVSVNVFPQGTPALTITKSASPSSGGDVQFGDTITYTLRMTNIGTALAANVVVTDDLPAGVAFVTGSGSSSDNLNESSGQVTVDATTLVPDQVLTATWQVTVTANTSGTMITNQASANSASTSLISSNVTSHRVITSVVTPTGPIFMPIIFKDCCLPNLTITNFQVDTGANPPVITIDITNNGQAPTESGFWVDFYLNPTTDPANLSGGDRRWQRVSSRGIAWPISAPLAAGDSLTLVSTAGIDPAQTNWTTPLAPGTYTFVSFVDSFDADGDAWVEIFESNEGDNQAKQTNVSVSGVLEQSAIEPEAAPAPAERRRDLSR